MEQELQYLKDRAARDEKARQEVSINKMSCMGFMIKIIFTYVMAVFNINTDHRTVQETN